MTKTAVLLAVVCSTQAMSATKKVSWEFEGATYEGVLIGDAKAGARPGVVLAPNWLGVTDDAVSLGEQVASRGLTVLVADVYGVKSRPKDREEAGRTSGALKGDRPLLRRRMAKALEVLRSQKDVPLAPGALGVIGFCFGGTAALELARSGAEVGVVVSFHGGLSSPQPADAKNIKGKVLVLHGAEDPSVPPDEVAAFEAEMRAAKVDWQLVSFGGAVHSFTDPKANAPGRAQYHPVVAARAFSMMDALMAEVFGVRRER